MIVTQVYKHAFVGGHNIVEVILKIGKLANFLKIDFVELKNIIVIWNPWVT